MAKKKKIMVSARLREISAVDKPAQAPALVDIRKDENGDLPLEEQVEAPVAGEEITGAECAKNDSEELNPAGSEDVPSIPAGNTDPMNEEINNEQIESLTKRAERAEKAFGLNDAEKALFVKMDVENQERFLNLTSEERTEEIQNEITKAAELNPVIYTSSEGVEFKKNDDTRLVDMAKQLDEVNAEKSEIAKAARLAAIAKRGEELSNLPGTPEQHVLLVEAVAKMAEEQQTELNEILDTLNGNLAKAFEETGTSDAPEAPAEENLSIETQIEGIAKSIRTENPELSEAQAYAKALTTNEGLALYSQHLNTPSQDS